jgi:Fe-S-cluster containining protein
MPVDQDRPSTWKSYRSHYCETCNATCCTMPVEVKLDDLFRLGLASPDEASAKKIGKRLQAEGIVRSYRAATGLFLLEQKNGRDCVFLGSDRRCTVYERRPDVCRDFPLKVGPRPGFCPSQPKRA